MYIAIKIIAKYFLFTFRDISDIDPRYLYHKCIYNYLWRREKQIRLVDSLDNFVQRANVLLAIQSEMRSQQIRARIVGHLKKRRETILINQFSEHLAN